MQHVLEFWNFFFWGSLLLMIFGGGNILNLIILTELLWGIIYIICVLLGVKYNTLVLVSFGFFVLVFAALEFILGLFLITLLKNFNISEFIFKENNTFNAKHDLFNFKKINFNYINL